MLLCSVYKEKQVKITICRDCNSKGINLPNFVQCGDCGSDNVEFSIEREKTPQVKLWEVYSNCGSISPTREGVYSGEKSDISNFLLAIGKKYLRFDDLSVRHISRNSVSEVVRAKTRKLEIEAELKQLELLLK